MRIRFGRNTVRRKARRGIRGLIGLVVLIVIFLIVLSFVRCSGGGNNRFVAVGTGGRIEYAD